MDLGPLLGEALTTSFRSVYFEWLRVLPDDRGIYGFPDAIGLVARYIDDNGALTLAGDMGLRAHSGKSFTG